jgi:hypothetical protein
MMRQVVRSPAVVIAALLSVALAVALAVAVASWIRGRSAGPLQALSASGELTVDGASVAVPPGGSADFTAFVVNPLRSPIRLVSATVVPVTGERPTGRLVHVGISTTPDMAGAAVGWPIHDLPTRPLSGALIGHGQSDIIFGIAGPVSGRAYSVAGLRIGYRYGHRTYYVVAWSAAVACVTTRYNDSHSLCPNAAANAQSRVKQMAGDSP